MNYERNTQYDIKFVDVFKIEIVSGMTNLFGCPILSFKWEIWTTSIEKIIFILYNQANDTRLQEKTSKDQKYQLSKTFDIDDQRKILQLISWVIGFTNYFFINL